ncbi:hypothetical protein BJ166DRAFT_542764 [Pestalotiopsis sp. NC0098]|nr:hypothetical protein BJ166DRAFT_542764 [Pestalotiopsis sp. NC0098]
MRFWSNVVRHSRLSNAEADALYREQQIMAFLHAPEPARPAERTLSPEEVFSENFEADKTKLYYLVGRVELYYDDCAESNFGNLVGDLVQAYEVAEKYFVGASDVAGSASSTSFPGVSEAHVVEAREALEPIRRRLVRARQGFIQDHEWEPIMRDARMARQGRAATLAAGHAVDDVCRDESWEAEGAGSRRLSRSRPSRKFSFEEIPTDAPC